jgi:hypothetical protein
MVLLQEYNFITQDYVRLFPSVRLKEMRFSFAGLYNVKVLAD